MILYLSPRIGVNEFTFKSDINEYTNFDFHYTRTNGTGYDTYDIDDSGLSIYVENNLIESIACTEELLYKGCNIIGMYITEFMSYYEVDHSGSVDKIFVNNEELQEVYEFDTLGLQLWCRKDKVTTAIASY